MMNIDDIKEKLKTEWQTSVEKLNDSPSVIQIKDKYENLSPLMQKLTLWGGALVIFLCALAIPYSWHSASQEHVDTFLYRRGLIRDLLKAKRDSQSAPQIPVPPSVDTLMSISKDIADRVQLLPEQIIGITRVDEETAGLRADLTQGLVQIRVGQLNLRQIVDMGHQLQSISPSVKLKDLTIEEVTKSPGYFDVSYKLLVLNVPDLNANADNPAPPAPKVRGKR
jgi:hypothetical protein